MDDKGFVAALEAMMLEIDELVDELYGLRCTIGSLEQENAKLRKMFDDLASKGGDDADE